VCGVGEKGVCTPTVHTHLACPPACPTRAPRMRQAHRRKKQGKSAIIGGAGWGVQATAEGLLAPPQGTIEKTSFSIVTKRAPKLKAYI